jgi:hypothetical protein
MRRRNDADEAAITIRSSDQGDSVTDELIAMAWADERVCAGSSRAGTCAPGVNFATSDGRWNRTPASIGRLPTRLHPRTAQSSGVLA